MLNSNQFLLNLSSTVGGGKSIIFRVFRAVGRMVVRVGV